MTACSERKNIAILFGGRSVEHEISVITALELISALDVRRYNPIPVYIDAFGRWYTGSKLLESGFYKGLPKGLSKLEQVRLLALPGAKGLRKIAKMGHESTELIPVDIYFPAFHGQYGEDGCIQGLFEMADVTYTGCRVMSAAIAMNKYCCKSLLRAHGIPVLAAYVANKSDAIVDIEFLCQSITSFPGLKQFPLFVKPCNLGSSIGISKVDSLALLPSSLALAFKYDSQAIVEPCVSDMFEINISVLRWPDGTIRASVVEIPVATAGTLTFEDKYLRGGKKSAVGTQGMASLTRAIDPADLDNRYKSEITAAAIRSYKILECAGVVRFDFIVDKSSGNWYFNELNTLPGSLAHYLWAKSNPPLLYTELLDIIISQAEVGFATTASLERNIGFNALHK